MKSQGIGAGICAGLVAVVTFAACGGDDKPAAGSNPDGGASASSGGPSTSGGNPSTSGGGPGGTGTPGPGTSTAGCKIFPNDNPWNTDISAVGVDTALTAAVTTLNPTRGLHPDWGGFADEDGIPVNAGPGGAPQKISFNTSYGPKESDKIPCAGGGGDFCYPIPFTVKIEGGSGATSDADRHVIFLDTTNGPDHCVLYELYNAQNPSGGWTCASGAVFHLDTNALRPDQWTSADAAGLPILPGLVRKEEVDKGVIPHALRFTMNKTQNGFIHPATHSAGDTAAGPPMGMRVRLKAGFDDSKLSATTKVITAAMKKYGMILADNGSDWFVSGETNDAWDMDPLVQDFEKIKGGDFEIVQAGPTIPGSD